MEIYIVYVDNIYDYVVNIKNRLESIGVTVTLMHLDDYDGDIQIEYAPVFFMKKYDKLSYPLFGRQTMGSLENWINMSGV